MMVIWWRRQRAFLDFCLAALLRRKLKNGALLAGYALIVFMLASVLFFAEALRTEATAVLADAPEMVVQRMLTGRYAPIPVDYQNAIAAIRGVRTVTPRYWGYYYHPAAKANYTVMAVQQETPGPGQAHLGSGVARTWHTGPQAPIYFKTYDGKVLSLMVTNLLPDTTELVSSDLILVHRNDFDTIFGLPEDQASDLAVSVRNLREAQTIAEKIVQRLPDTRPVLREEMVRTYSALFDWRSGYTLVMFGGAVLAFFIFALDKATGLSAQERTEIAVLKAIGWDTGDVLALKFYEGLIISFSAFLVGVIGAYLHVYVARGLLFEHALKGWGVLYPRFDLLPSVDFYQLASLLGLTVFPYALMTIIPAWRAATMDPDTVMRQL